MKKIIFLIISILFFIEMQASNVSFKNNQKKDILQEAKKSIDHSLYLSDQLNSACGFLTVFKPEMFEENKIIRFKVAASAKCIKEMRLNADFINNSGLGLVNWIKRVPKNHSANMHQAKIKIAGILLDQITKSESCDITSDDTCQYDWCKETEQQTIAWSVLLNQRKEILENINRLYHENQPFDYSEVQEKLKGLKLNHLAKYENKYSNVTKFFGYEKNCLADITAVANLHEDVEKIFASKNT
ncbi:MAG: hypothetical protein ACXWL5_03430 [Candidatus Chromulinivorax sp.]